LGDDRLELAAEFTVPLRFGSSFFDFSVCPAEMAVFAAGVAAVGDFERNTVGFF
jgi:hypothetical protein